MVGGLAAYELKKFEQERSEIYLYDLAVAEGHRRRGIATALVNALTDVGRRCGAFVVFVQADKPDAGAIAFYSGRATFDIVEWMERGSAMVRSGGIVIGFEAEQRDDLVHVERHRYDHDGKTRALVVRRT